MKIAFDAKRAYQNSTGLGHYSRTLISSLATYYPQHHYFLCAPKLTTRYDISAFGNMTTLSPTGFVSKQLKSLWRSNLVKKDLVEKGVDLYHGLSHEIPLGIQKTGIRSVVTMHDLIFERYPEQYNKLDVLIYRQKFQYACKTSDHIIAISEQTKEDLINFYQVPQEKISVCYQSCDPAFSAKVSIDEKMRIKDFYDLPERFFLYVGSIIERKNLLNICKALKEVKGKTDVKLVVIGEGGDYKKQVKEYIAQYNLSAEVIFLSDQKVAQNGLSFQSGADFPAIFQLSQGLIYPSVFEGFGIPVLEALWSKTPVITSDLSCLPETGGDAAYYVDPHSVQDLAAGMLKIASDQNLADDMRARGWQHAQHFTPQNARKSNGGLSSLAMIDFTPDIEDALKVLLQGGIILYPTDTIWGLGCDATNTDAVEKLIALKGKPPNKGLIVMLASERDVLHYTANPDLAVFDYLNTTTKPTTVIYEHGLAVANDVLNEDGSIAIRLVKEDFCRHLLKRFKKPLVSTSANLHGQPSPQNFADVSEEIKLGVDYVVKYRQNDILPHVASSIIKWKNGNCLIIRS